MTPQGQLRTLHFTTDGGGSSERKYGVHPSASEVRSTTRGKAEGGESRPVSNGQMAGNRHNRVLVLGSDGKALMPCSIQRAKELIKAGRVKTRWYQPFTIQLKDRALGDGTTAVQPMEIRCDPGAKHTGLAVVIQLKHEDRVVYQEEITHRGDISQRMLERKAHRGRRRGQKWYRAPRFNNRTRPPDWLPPSKESIVSNQYHRIVRLSKRTGATEAVLETAKFDTQKLMSPDIQGTQYQQGTLY